MDKIRLHYLVGDVHLGGHDVRRVAKNNRILLEKSDAFDITMICDDPRLGDVSFDEYFASADMEKADVFVFNCGGARFNCEEEQHRLENAVKNGAGFVFLHGDHPCYWTAVGFPRWDEVEKMAGLMWREPTSHGDYAYARVTNRLPDHPIMRGLPDFDTKDEVFCGCANVHGVPLTTLATAYSDANVLSRHGHPGTGRDEPIAVTGSYGKGRTFNFLLGHVWPFYTGHGLGENTMLSYAPRPVRMMFVRGCEWAATGDVVRTASFRGEAQLF